MADDPQGKMPVQRNVSMFAAVTTPNLNPEASSGTEAISLESLEAATPAKTEGALQGSGLRWFVSLRCFNGSG